MLHSTYTFDMTFKYYDITAAYYSTFSGNVKILHILDSGIRPEAEIYIPDWRMHQAPFFYMLGQLKLQDPGDFVPVSLPVGE